ncbi:hypothetical protein NP493_919g01065 [Ridgeia piscesae]|uniref:Uncharacterized protein n=1 Tax=Ridgeia piscesae TaxID=27915 RepID=A0AAD9KKP0_RIDPI|nr:hypothetical protein NP493_919g01065 [Ridgeia piscesae]
MNKQRTPYLLGHPIPGCGNNTIFLPLMYALTTWQIVYAILQINPLKQPTANAELQKKLHSDYGNKIKKRQRNSLFQKLHSDYGNKIKKRQRNSLFQKLHSDYGNKIKKRQRNSLFQKPHSDYGNKIKKRQLNCLLQKLHSAYGSKIKENNKAVQAMARQIADIPYPPDLQMKHQ